MSRRRHPAADGARPRSRAEPRRPRALRRRGEGGTRVRHAGDSLVSEPERANASGSSGAQWWREAVIYENHLPSLRDGNGDGIGDLEGLIESLDYLGNTLGVDAIWTGPFFRSPLLDQGFDVTESHRGRTDVRRPRDLRPIDRGGPRSWPQDHRRLRPQPHVRPTPLVHGFPLVSRRPEAGLVRVGRPRTRRRSTQQLDERGRRLLLGVRSGERSVLPAFSPSRNSPT